MAISRIETNSIAPSQTLTTPIVATTMGVGGATPSGSGSGITFPAAQSASTDANTLDDYEEGTWTPTLPNGGTLSIQSAAYTKIGRQVTVTTYLTSVAPTNNSSEFLIGGLPFVVANAIYYGGSFGYAGDSNLSGWLVLGIANYSNIGFRLSTGSNTARTNAQYLTAASGSDDSFIITITYFTS